MADSSVQMPRRGEVDPLFDGHHEKRLLELTVEERLDWIWQSMQLLNLGRATREAAKTVALAPTGDNVGLPDDVAAPVSSEAP